MDLFCTNFRHQQRIPPIYTCDGQNTSPPLKWSNVPEGTASFALSVIDPDAPGGNFIHWLVYDIPKNVSDLSEGGPLPDNSKELTNDFGTRSYGGPCPPSGTHRYFFTLYALKMRELRNITRSNFLREVNNNAIAQAELIGLYSRERN